MIASQICAGELAGNKDTCQGDSGGPLFIKDTIGGKTKYVLSGITSYGNDNLKILTNNFLNCNTYFKGDGCGLKERPGIYARVSSYIDWINKNRK